MARGIRNYLIRKHLAYGKQRDYFDHKTTIGWTRAGIDEKPDSGCAVILSCGNDGWKYMELGKEHARKVFVDGLGKVEKEVTLDENGAATFYCKGGSVSVWLSKKVIESKLLTV